ncbi:hypothetical protein [Devosia aurantiaca]|uniref:Uncharacterized protein n=1 Tax=Devosia aurantiaca TaxID=2714858 RepID=A0A6M1SY01_9HYPH|nr:hypothetical protein [Devosia aurantiaca]NGP19153.1 hypothetical protein [Devosia aurantiaca]
MTPAEADQRIILSRRTISTYMAMINRGDLPNQATMMMISEEVEILEGLAMAHPGKAVKIARLLEKWQDLISAMRAKLN